MIRDSTTSYLCGIFFALSLVVPAPAAGQLVAEDSTTKIVHILWADNVARLVRNNLRVRELTGHVRMRQDSTYLWADKVTQYLTLDEILLIGNVLIVEDSDSLVADSVLYFTQEKRGRARGNVRLSDGDVQVFAPSALYYAEEKHSIFDETVRLVDSLTVLTSLQGEYFSEEKRAEFFGDVVLMEDRTYLEADSLTYFRETEVSLGYGDVFIERIGGEDDTASEDSTARTFLFGDYAYNDNRSGYSKITGDALLFQFRTDSLGAAVDSLIMKAATLEAIREDSLQRLIAVDSVQIWRQDFAAVADSAVYDRVSIEGEPLFEENRMYQGPLAWFESYQLSGDTLRATARAGHVDTLKVRQQAFAAFQDTTTNRINQLKGQHLTGLFEQDSLKSLTVGPQAESIYFRWDDEKNRISAMKSSADQIQLYFKGNELDELKMYQGIKVDYYDGSLIPEPFELGGFQWTPDRKPTSAMLREDASKMFRIESLLKKPEPVEVPLPRETPAVSPEESVSSSNNES